MEQAEVADALSGRVVGSFAYRTIRERMPTILAKVVDTAHRQRHEISAKFGQEGADDVKRAVGALSELRYRLQTDKPILPFSADRMPDAALWNAAIADETERTGSAPTWFSSPWLLVECYMYRKIVAAFESSNHLRDWDPFQFQKEQAFVGSLAAQQLLGARLLADLDAAADADDRAALEHAIQTSLWGNRSDMSLSGGEQCDDSGAVEAATWRSRLVVDELPAAVAHLRRLRGTAARVDLVLDNAGLELFGDLCLADVLLERRFAATVVLHVKVGAESGARVARARRRVQSLPWFVSDVTPADLGWTLEMLRASERPALNRLGHRWHARLERGELLVRTHAFWTLPHSFDTMARVAPDLHADLAGASLVVFKGDLNYRKLLADRAWPQATPLCTALQGFAPAPLLLLRTLKAELIVGVALADVEAARDDDWLVSGNYAVVQFFNPRDTDRDVAQPL